MSAQRSNRRHDAVDPSAARPRWRAKLVPDWLAGYQRSWLRADVVAGVTLAAYLLPSGIGDASLAGLPPEAGLYACMFSGLVFWLFCGSRQTAITVTSAISLLLGATLGAMAEGDVARYAALAAAAAIMVGAMALLAWLIRAGAVTNFISETVLAGFKTGIALHLASTQLPKLCGFSGTHGNFWERAANFLAHLPQTNVAACLIGGGALVVLLLGRWLCRNRPVALVVVIVGVVLGATDLVSRHGVALLGEVPGGFPVMGLPRVGVGDLNDLLPLAMACFLLGAVESAAIGRTFALRHGYRFNADREFLALGAANLMAGLGRGYPVSGGLSQSLVNDSAGARTPISGLIAAGIVVLVTVFLSGLLRTLPQPVLAAIVIVAVVGLVQIDALKRTWQFSRSEFAVAMVVLLGVLTAGLLKGVLIGVIVSILLLLRRASRPPVTELGRVPGTDYFADLQRHPENQRTPGILVFRSEGALLYFNVEHVRDRVAEVLRMRLASGEKISLAIYFLGAVPLLDLAGAELLVDLRRTLDDRGITLRLAEAHGNVRDALRRVHFDHDPELVQPNQTVADILGRWQLQREGE